MFGKLQSVLADSIPERFILIEFHNGICKLLSTFCDQDGFIINEQHAFCCQWRSHNGQAYGHRGSDFAFDAGTVAYRGN